MFNALLGNRRGQSRQIGTQLAAAACAVVERLEGRQLFAIGGGVDFTDAIGGPVAGPAAGLDEGVAGGTPAYGFALGRGSTGADSATSVAHDTAGNAYVGGSFSGIVDFDPIGTANLNSANGIGFIAKYTPAGTLLWARNVGGAVNDVAVDNSGNVVATGGFEGTKDFNPGGGVANLTSAGAQDIFVLRLTHAGAYSWARRMGGATYSDVGNSIAVDSTGRAYVTGYFHATVDFDPGAAVHNLTAQALTDAFVLRLTSSGAYSFAKAIRGNGTERGNGIALDPTGNIYTVGRFDKTADFNPGGSTYNLEADDSLGGTNDAYISKLNSSGNFLWAERMGGAFWDEATDVAIGPDGSAYATGFFTYEAKFNPGDPTDEEVLSAKGGSGADVFVSRHRGDGELLWARNMGSDQTDEQGLGIDVDNGGNAYTTGRFRGTADFNPLGGTANLTSGGGTDAFVSKLTALGEHVFARKFGGAGTDAGRAIAVDAARGNIFTVGSFEQTVDFDPGAGASNQTSDGGTDAFISKVTEPTSPLQFALDFGGIAADEGRKVVTDASGNIYVAGRIQGFTYLDPQAVAPGFNSGSDSDVYVAKYTRDGVHLWSHRAFRREVSEDVAGIALDPSGNVIVAGSFQSTPIDFADDRLLFPDGTLLESDFQTRDVFIWKLNSSGDTIWAKKFGQSGAENAKALAVDNSGNIFVAGQFDFRLSYGPSFSDEVEAEGGQDVYFAKFNSSGNIQWARSIGGAADEDVSDMTVDASGKLYLAGSFKSAACDLNPHSGLVTNRALSGTESAFVLKTTSSGYMDWGRAFGGSGATAFNAIALASGGDVLVGGRFTGTLTASAGLAALASGGGSDALIVRLNGADGAAEWGRRAGGLGADQVNDLAIGGGGGSIGGLADAGGGTIHATGSFANTVDFDPSAGTSSQSSAGGTDAFHWALSSAGNFVKARKFGGGGTDVGHAIALPAGTDDVILTGSYRDAADFAPGAEFGMLGAAGDTNVFLVKLID